VRIRQIYVISVCAQRDGGLIAVDTWESLVVTEHYRSAPGS